MIERSKFLCELPENISNGFGNIMAKYFFHVTKFNNKIDWTVRYIMPKNISIGANCILRRGILIDARSTNSPSISIGDDCRIKEYVSLCTYGGKICIGQRVLIGQATRIFGHGGITIGNDTMIGNGVSIVSSNHICTISKKPFQNQGFTREPIEISSNVWIGDNSVIVGGVKIEKDVIVGAGSVVTNDLQSGYIYAGTPAKKNKSIPIIKPNINIYYVNWI